MRAHGGYGPTLAAALALGLAVVLAWATALLEPRLRFNDPAAAKLKGLLAAMAGLGLLGLADCAGAAAQLTSARVAAVTRQLRWDIPVGSPAQAQACRRLMPPRAVGAGVEGNDFCYLQRARADVALLGDSMNLSLFPGLADHGDINVLLASASEAALYDTTTTEALTAPALPTGS
jgi:hypothetical protein